MGHVGLTPQAVNILGGYGVRGKSDAEARSIVEDAVAVAKAGAFAIVIEGVLESIAIEITKKVECPTIGIGASAQRSEEHTSELQSLMRISYAVFCCKKKKK